MPLRLYCLRVAALVTTTYSFAAPTAGNRDFAAYTDARIGATLHRVWNSLDVVPHAWAEADLGAIDGLYKPAIPGSLLVDLFTRFAEDIASKGDYTQIKPDAGWLPGTISGSILTESFSDGTVLRYQRQ